MVRLLDRRAEHGEDRVADEFVDRALFREDGVGHLREEAVEQRRDFRGRQRLGERREPDDVGEQHADVAIVRREHIVAVRVLLRHDPLDDGGRMVALQPLAAFALVAQPLG